MKNIVLLSLLFLVGCSDSITPEDSRFNHQAISRFRIQRERTPVNFPDFYLIHDSVSGADFIAISDDHHLAISLLPKSQPEKP